MESESSLPCSQHPTSCPYPEPDQSSSRRLSCSWQISFNIIPYSRLGLPNALHAPLLSPLRSGEGERFQIWVVDPNILNMQSRIADKRWSSSLGVGREANDSLP